MPVTPEEFKKADTSVISEVIIKQPLSKSEVGTAKENENLKIETHSYREGFMPTSAIAFIERGFSKVTMVVDDGLQVLTVPEKAQGNKRAINKLRQSKYIAQQKYDTIYMMPKARPNFLYNLSKDMLKGVKASGITLKKID